MERYQRLFECDCENCEKKEACQKKKNLKESIKVCEACSCNVNDEMDHGLQYEDDVELETGDWVSDSVNDKLEGGGTFGDKPATDGNWSESIGHYEKIFEDDELDGIVVEDCPYKPAGGGACGNADNTVKLKGKCQSGYQWSSDKEACFKVADTKK